MLPFELIEAVHDGIDPQATFWTSYTHQWGQPWFDARHLRYSMASIDDVSTIEELHALHGPDVRTYRILLDDDTSAEGEIMCPARGDQIDAFGRRLVTCNTCLLCSGTQGLQAKSITVDKI